MKKKLLLAFAALLPVLAWAQPANDNCANAIELTVSTSAAITNTLSATLQNATDSGIPAACTGVPDDDVWYRFTATATRHAISFSNLAGSPNVSLVMEVYEGSCTGTLVKCASTTNSIQLVKNLAIGTTYYMRVFSNAGPTSMMPVITYTLGVATPNPAISVDPDQYTAQELVQDVLAAPTGITVSNVTFSTGITFAANEPNGIGYFEQNGSGFLFEDGIILSTGIAANAEGPNGTILHGGTNAWLGDADIAGVLYNTAFPNLNTTNNATVLEFDFVPEFSNFSLSYVFASDEYGPFQCMLNDGVAIFLTNTQTDEVSNIAVIPYTAVPISVQNIKNNQYNTQCTSANAVYFGDYSEPQSMEGATNFNGQTVQMAAEAVVIPGATYHLKIVVADQGDTAVDSAIFLQGGSMRTGPVFDDSIITLSPAPYVTCEQEYDGIATFDLNMYAGGLINNPQDYTFSWFTSYANAMANTNAITSTSYTTQSATETLYARVFSVALNTFDVVPVVFVTEPQAYIYTPSTGLGVCDGDDTNDGYTTVDLTVYNAQILGDQDPALITLHYYATYDDVYSYNPIPNPESFVTNSTTIYAAVYYTNTISQCISSVAFDVEVMARPVVEITSTGSGFVCVDETGQVVQPITLNSGLPQDGYTFDWFRNNEPISAADSNTVVATQAGSYTVVANGALCSSNMSDAFTVTLSAPATPVGSGYTVNGQEITVTVEGPGEYLYSLSAGGPYDENTVLDAPGPGTYTVYVTDANGCGTTMIANIVVTMPNPPEAAATQEFEDGQTLADLSVEGENLQWYADAEGIEPLSPDTVLEDGITYYVTQTVNGEESAPAPVSVYKIMGVENNSFAYLRCYPNPAGNELKLEHTATLLSATFYNTLGQQVLNATINNTQATLNLTGLASGVYLMKVAAENGERVVKVVKE